MTTIQAQPRNPPFRSEPLPPLTLCAVESTLSAHDQIARRAYEIYVASDRQPGCSISNWQRAEWEIALATGVRPWPAASPLV